ncbi:hypothetical protein HG531_006962 [Fusarium graminearum]|nr:hypothetical protein HG531_006962 [Fusarium graminearum]
MDSPSPGPSPALQAQNPAHRPPPPQGSGHPLLPALPYPHSDWPPGQYPPTGPPAQIQAGSSWAQVARAQFSNMLRLDPGNIIFDPKNPKYKRWSHAIPTQPGKQDRLHPDMSPEQMAKSMWYRSCFKTGDAVSLPDDLSEKAESQCRKRDGNKCVVTGRPNPRVFWFIPRGWNDTADHNDATGNFEIGCYYLTKIDLLETISVSGELGNTHKPWNMICIDPVLYDFLVRGYCAFSYVGARSLLDGTPNLNLKFFWMPKLAPRFHQVMDLGEIDTFELTLNADASTSFNIGDNDFGKELSVDLDYFQRLNCPPAPECEDRMSQITDFPVISSGHDVWINMTAPEATLFMPVAKIHWYCVVFSAPCGGAGRAWHLTGMDQRDGSLQPGPPVSG